MDRWKTTALLAMGMLACPANSWGATVTLTCDGSFTRTEYKTVTSSSRVSDGDYTTYDPRVKTSTKVPVQVTYNVSRIIKFDEIAHTFLYKGASKFDALEDSEGWLRATRVNFSETQIIAGIDYQAWRKPLFRKKYLEPRYSRLGILDRINGSWTTTEYSVPCVPTKQKQMF